MTSTSSFAFTFYTNDGGEHGIYGCSARSLNDAEALVRLAGYREFILFEQRLQEPAETAVGAEGRIRENPFLGPEWMPLVQAMDLATRYLRIGKFWQLTTYGKHFGYDPYRSPYAQVMLEADGSLHVEVSSTDTDSERFSAKQAAELDFLGWSAPVVEDNDGTVAERGSLPNSWRVLEPGWNGKQVAELILEALTIFLNVSPDDFFNLGEGLQPQLEAMGILEQIGDGPIFRLPGRSPAPDEPNSPDSETGVVDASPDKSDGFDQKVPESTDNDLVVSPSNDNEPMVQTGTAEEALTIHGLSSPEIDAARRALSSLARGLRLSDLDEGRAGFLNRWSTPITLKTLNRILEALASDSSVVRQKVAEMHAAFSKHPEVEAPLGAAILAIDGFNEQDGSPQERALYGNASPLLRALVAQNEKSLETLTALAFDSCAQVRWAVAGNEWAHPLTRGVLLNDSVREVVDAVANEISAERPRQRAGWLAAEDCPCIPVAQSMATAFRLNGLDLPALPPHLSSALTRWDAWHWATHPFPIAMDDYLFRGEHLTGAVPDQLSISHAGHGMNSYSLNLRMAVGPVTVLVQSSWGGAYTSNDTSAAKWNALVRHVNELLVLVDTKPIHEYRVRRISIRYSGFRSTGWRLSFMDQSDQSDVRFESWSETRATLIGELRSDERRAI